jgi:hypothetical protein
MKPHTSIRLSVAAASLLVAASAAAAPAHHGAAFKVTTTLDGKKVLPRRIPWVVSTPGLPRSQLKSGGIGFLIDNKIVSFTDEQPYTFPDHGGYLVTSFLTPGEHTFTVRVHAKDGTTVQHDVTARVQPMPAPPAALAGTWQRAVTDTSGAPKAGSPGNPTNTLTPAGTYTMTFDKRWIQSRFPGKFIPHASDKTGNGWIMDSDWTPGAKTFQVFGGVQFKVIQEIDAEGGWWCYAGGPQAEYSWSVSGDTLTLAPAGGSDACGVRGFIWAGEWTRAH